MSNKYIFKLAPAYCLYKGVVIVYQNGASIKFLLENAKDNMLKLKLRKAFCNYINYVTRQNDCTFRYRRNPRIEFKKSRKSVILKTISKIYGINVN